MPIVSTMPTAQRLWTPHSLPVFDAVGVGANMNGLTTLSWSHTAVAGAAVAVFLNDSSATPTSVTYGGTAMPYLGLATLIDVYCLNHVPGGAQTITATYASAAIALGNSISYAHVNSNSTLASTSGTGTSMSQVATVGLGAQLIVQAFAWPTTGTLSAHAGGTLRYSGTGTNGGLTISDAIGKTTFTGTLSSNSGTWAGTNLLLK